MPELASRVSATLSGAEVRRSNESPREDESGLTITGMTLISQPHAREWRVAFRQGKPPAWIPVLYRPID